MDDDPSLLQGITGTFKAVPESLKSIFGVLVVLQRVPACFSGVPRNLWGTLESLRDVAWDLRALEGV